MQNTASVYPIADEHRYRAESAAWVRFTSPADASDLYAGWLALVAARIDRARGGLLLTRSPQQGSYGVAAVWPDPRRDMQYLSPVAGVQAELEKIDPELANNPLLFPDDETVARTFKFANLTEDVEAEYDAAFSAITGA